MNTTNEEQKYSWMLTPRFNVDLVEKIDKARRGGISRASWLRQAAEEKLERECR
jgi:hypothetical protein